MTDDAINDHNQLLIQVLSLSNDATAIYTSEQLHISFANNAMLKFWGKNQNIINQTMEEAIPELQGQPFIDILKEVWRTGVSYSAQDMPAKLLRDGVLTTAYYDFEYRALLNAEGKTYAILHTSTDVTQQRRVLNLVKEKEEREQILNRELTAFNEELELKNQVLKESNESQQTINRELHQTQQYLSDAIDRLKYSQDRFQKLISEATVGIIVLLGPKMEVAIVNEFYGKLVGRKSRELLGKKLFEVIPDADRFYKPIIEKVLETGQPVFLYDTPYAIQNEEGLIKGYLNVVYQPYIETNNEIAGVMVLCHDVTAQALARKESAELNAVLQNANRKLQQTEDGLRLAIDTAQLGIWHMDIETGLFDRDERSRNILGFTSNDRLTIEDIRSVIEPEYRDLVTQTVAGAMHGKPGFAEYYTTNKITGNRSWIRGSAQFIPANGNQKAKMTGILTDLTAEKDIEQRKSDFIGIVSHELRSPLTSIKGYVQLLEMKAQKAGDMSTLEIASKANRQVERMSALIRGFLDVARLGETKIRLNRKVFNLTQSIQAVEQEVSVTVTTHTIVFGDLDCANLEADQDKIEQVLFNLINNAVKYSPQGSTIYIDCTTIDDQIEVAVSDNGMGISAKDQPYIFERFYRVEAEHTETIKGFGIGLYICKEIIERHGGSIGVRSNEGKGSRFWFRLPIIQ